VVRVQRSAAGHALVHAAIVTCSLLQHLTWPTVISGGYSVVIARLPAREDQAGGAGPGDAEGASGGRPDDRRGRYYLRIFTALATTRIPTATEIISSAIIMSFAHGLIAETSVGLNAIAVFTERCR
jgi:hypothetical protein